MEVEKYLKGTLMMISLVPDGTLAHVVTPELLRCGSTFLSAGLLGQNMNQNRYGKKIKNAWYGGVYIMTDPLCIHDDTVEHKGSRGMDQIQI